MAKILLIEDHADIRENTAEILELADYDVMTAQHGKEGVALAREASPDLIICDIMMPELDGYGVLRMLSRNPDTAGIPFIFLTAKAEKTDFRKGMNLGADDYITKPFDDVELLDAIDVRLAKHNKLKQDFGDSSEGLTHFINEARGRDALQTLSESRETRYFKNKELIFKEEGFPFGLYFVQKGKIRTYKTNADAKEYVTGLYKAGDFLGYLPLLQERVYEESAMAMEETEVVIIPKEDFFALLHNDRDVSYRFIQLLSENLSAKEEELLHLAYDSVRKRVADALLHLRETFKEKEEPFRMAVTRDHLASLVGTSKECVIRVLSDFKEEGLVETRMSEITIRNPEGLKAVRY